MATSNRFPTRILLSAAAIGAAGGVFVIALNWSSVLASALLGPLAFLVYAATIALWIIPAFLAQALLRRPGIGLLAAVLMGLVNAPFVQGGGQQILNFVVAGVLLELPFLVGLYRTWSPRAVGIRQFITALVFSGVYTYLVFLGFDARTMPAAGIWVAVIVGAVISSGAAPWIAGLLAARLRAAGVGDGRATRSTATAATETEAAASARPAAEPAP